MYYFFSYSLQAFRKPPQFLCTKLRARLSWDRCLDYNPFRKSADCKSVPETTCFYSPPEEWAYDYEMNGPLPDVVKALIMLIAFQ